MKPRLVLIVTDPLTARYLLRGQAAFLRREGFDVWVVASPGPDLERFRERESVRTIALPMRRRIRPLSDLFALVRLVRVLHRLRPDVVNASTPKAGVLGAVAAWIARTPQRIYMLRGLPMATTTGIKRAVLRLAERTAAALSHRVVCVSPSLRRLCIELGIVDGEKAILIANGTSNGVDTQRFRLTPERCEEAAALRRQLGIPAEAPVVGCVGRLTRDKGIDDLAAAFLDDVAPVLPDCRLLMVGAFEDEDPVAAATRRRLEEDPRVVITGWMPDSAPFYAVMDVLAFPSYREGFPNAPLEAGASERPTVGFAAVGTVDAVADGQTGRLVPTGDRAALGRALRAYLEDDALRQRHGAAARRRAHEMFRCQIVWQAWAEEYRSLVAR